MPVLRAAEPRDLSALYEMAKGTGGGFTNLPPDRQKLEQKLLRAQAAFTGTGAPGSEHFMFMLEAQGTGAPLGTCQIFSKIGMDHPFYSYRVDIHEKHSSTLARTIRSELLTLCTDHAGCTEVGGLFLNAGERSAGAGSLLARSRYLFIRAHRELFADRTIAELRGVVDEAGGSPFWDGVAGRFLGMTFREADELIGTHGSQVIASLVPESPIYKAVLDEAATEVIGIPHRTGRPAMRMLEKEGFVHDRYIDIFDGGPTMSVLTDSIATTIDAHDAMIVEVSESAFEGIPSILSSGKLADFRACFGLISKVDGGIRLDAAAALALGVIPGDTVSHVPR